MMDVGDLPRAEPKGTSGALANAVQNSQAKGLRPDSTPENEGTEGATRQPFEAISQGTQQGRAERSWRSAAPCFFFCDPPHGMQISKIQAKLRKVRHETQSRLSDHYQ